MKNIDTSLMDKMNNKAQSNATEALVNGKRFGIKSGTLMEFNISTGEILRILVNGKNGTRWTTKNCGIVFAPYFYDVKFLTASEAKEFEKAMK